MEEQRTKSVESSATGDRRLRFVGTKKRSAKASADVYRVASNKDCDRIVIDESDESTSRFAIELDFALDRNSSQGFQRIHSNLFPLTRSLPELLLHLPQIVTCLFPKDEEEGQELLVLPDVLHLLGVLARETRQELHPFVHTILFPNIFQILWKQQQQPTLQVHIVEASFRALSNILRYDSRIVQEEEEEDEGTPTRTLRHYYGPTFGSSSSLIRRLAGQTFALFLRKLKTQSMCLHVKRVLKSFASSSIGTTPAKSNTKVYQDTMDGISWFLFYIVRGVPGRIHSKGILVIQVIFQSLLTITNETSILASLVSQFLKQLCDHIPDPTYFEPVWQALYSTMEKCVNSKKHPQQSLKYVLDLMEQCASLNSNCLLVDDTTDTTSTTKVLDKVEYLKKNHEQLMLSTEVHKSMMKFLCTYWKAQPTNPICLQKIPQLLLQPTNSTTTTNKYYDNNTRTCLFLVQQLIPDLPLEIGYGKVVPLLLEVAVNASNNNDNESALHILHAVATMDIDTNKEHKDDDTTSLFRVMDPEIIKIVSSSTTNRDLSTKLIPIVLQDITLKETEDVKGLLFLLRCVPLLYSMQATKKICQKILYWLGKIIQCLDGRIQQDPTDTNLVVAKALVLEITSLLIVDSDSTNTLVAKEIVERMTPSAQSFLFQNPTSVWTMRGTFYFLKAAVAVDPPNNLFGSVDQVFDILSPNLRQCNHYLRLYTLCVLDSLPKKQFVVNHADIDFTGDLDEEPSSSLSRPGSFVFSGSCDVISTLLKIESLPIHMENERQLTSYVNRVEVLGRSGSLPVAYAEAAANHMLGLLSLKFAPVWPAATRAFAGLLLPSSSSIVVEKAILNSLVSKVESVLLTEVSSFDTDANILDVDDSQENKIISDYRAAAHCHANLCIQWELSNGSNIDIFGRKQYALMPKCRCTDEWTLFELVLGVMEAVPEVVAKKSKNIVPLFIGFLHFDYFTSSEDPDVRELCLSDQVPADTHSSRQEQSKQALGRKALNKKLICFLKVFAAVTGPQQLYKHKLLAGIYFAFLSNPDPLIAQLAFDCLARYKLVYLSPYKEQLQKLLRKGEMKDALLGLDLSTESPSCVLEVQHRNQFIPVLTRLLFGRLASKGGGGKSSKDSPKQKRRAILSFLAKLSSSDNELDYFIFLMIRAFIPFEHRVKRDYLDHGLEPVSFPVKQFTDFVKRVSVREIANIPYQKTIGFLNLLADAISQLGYGIYEYIDIFMPIILSMCEYAAIHRTEADRFADGDLSSVNVNIENEDLCIEESDYLDSPDLCKNHCKLGAIRSLCYQRLSQLFLQFASSYNFIQYCNRMWAALEGAIENLPSSVVHATQCPSLLRLLNDLSSHPSLIPVLAANPLAIEAAFKCIDVTSHLTVVELSLGIVDQLLTEGGLMDSSHTHDEVIPTIGRTLVTKHMHYLVTQMSSRICTRSLRQTSMGSLAKKELSILCRVSDLIEQTSLVSETVLNDENKLKEETLDMLCGALVSFLSPERFEKDDVRINILRILNNFIGRLSKISATKLFVPFSKLLGPFKSSAGIVSPEIRLLTISGLEKISVFADSSFRQVVSALKCLHTLDSRHVGEYNFEVVLPTLNKLGIHDAQEGSWEGFLSKNPCDDWGPRIILPLLLHCLHSLYSTDGVLSRGAFKALKAFVFIASKDDNTYGSQSISRILETSMMPVVRSGLLSKNDAVHRFFVQILCEVSRNFATSPIPTYCGDLSILIRDDDAEQDFFLNTSHVQIHRRARALSRLRRDFLTRSDHEMSESNNESAFTQSSLSNVLLPLSLRPLFAEKLTDESYSLEAVATVGAIARYLTWTKYDSALCDLLRQFPRYPHQERFFIGAICSILDAFHFKVTRIEFSTVDEGCSSENNTEGEDSLPLDSPPAADNASNVIWKALQQRIIPRTEQLLKKHLTDKTGSRVQQLRSPIALALTKLLQKLPSEVLELKLPRLVLEVCTALKSRDSDCREVARDTLAKMAASLGENYLNLILRHLATNLTEGYQLHVRSATLHSILLSLSNVYIIPQFESDDEAKCLPFDQCIPAIMDLVQQDLFGLASEMKEVEYVEKRLVKEAMGSKSVDTLEIVCKNLLFYPSLAAESSGKVFVTLPSSSAVHNIVIPLLERLRLPDISSATIGKIRECLTKIVVGLSQNPTVSAVQLMPFVHATVAPFLLGSGVLSDYSEIDVCGDDDSSYAEDSDYDETEEPITVIGTKDRRMLLKHTNQTLSREQLHKRKPTDVTQWHPSTLDNPVDSKSARALNAKQNRLMQQVLDGENAPKLTGKARYGLLDKIVAENLNDPSKACGVIFGLSLLHSCLKKSKMNSTDLETLSMADPFVPMLTHCITTCENNEIVLLSLKLLGHLLYWDLPSMKQYQRKLASNVLKLLALSGGVLSSKHEVTHGCFKALTLLFDKQVLYDHQDSQEATSEEVHLNETIDQGDQTKNPTGVVKLPLNKEQMKVLVSMLLLSMTDTEHHNSTFSLIKAIVSRRFLSPEFYDLIEKLLELSVQSLKAGVRQHSSSIFLKFLITYPLDRKRLLQHLQQIVLNIKYEYEEGRLSAIKLLDSVVDKLPLPLLEQHGKIFFFPLVLQLVNDESNSCREAVAHVITNLFKRSSMDQLQLYYDYMKRWFLEQGDAASSLRRTSAQLFGLLVESRADFFVGRKNNVSSELLDMINTVLKQEISKEEPVKSIQWETSYFCLVCFEKVVKKSLAILSSDSCVDVWVKTTEFLVYPHPWVKQVSSRIILSHLQSLSANSLDFMKERSSTYQSSFIVKELGSLFQIARNICIQLNCSDDQYNESIAVSGIKILTWISLRMRDSPHLCYKETDMSKKDPLFWLITRLANMSKEKGNQRRATVFKCFASIICAESSDENGIAPYLEVMLEALHRPIAEEEGASANNRSSLRSSNTSSLSETTDLPKEVMNVLEEKCGSEAFLNAYANVKLKAREKKMARKQMIMSEAINDPKEAAKRKIQKQTKEKERKKRKIEERKASRGVFTKKKSRLNDN